MELPTYLKSIARLPDSFEEEFKSIIVRKELSKGNKLFEQGEICQQIYYVEKGLLRIYYYTSSGKEVTAWFFPENSFLTAIDSFFYHKETRDYCEALEDAVVYIISYDDMLELLNTKEGARMAFHALFELTRKMTEFFTSIKFQTADERYKAMMQEYPSRTKVERRSLFVFYPV